jgi:hypothetical protein
LFLTLVLKLDTLRQTSVYKKDLQETSVYKTEGDSFISG